MTKRGRSAQLDLNLPVGKKVDVRCSKPIQVVPFIDAATLEVRRNAVRRASASGIFYVHPQLRKR